jgi:hypothetical protein
MLLGASNSFQAARDQEMLFCALLGGGTVAIVAALGSVGADIVAAISGQKSPEQNRAAAPN